MRMAAVSGFFDREQAYDGYSGAAAFKCQFSSFDDAAADGTTNRRRGMSVQHGTTLPARRVVRLSDQRWIISDPTDDSFQDVTVRVNYNLRKATHLLSVLTPAQAALAASGVSTYAQLYYFKDTANPQSETEYSTFWNAFFARAEAVAEGAFFRDADQKLYRVRQSYMASEGFVVAQTDQLDSDARQAAVFNTGTYNAVTDSFAAGTTNAHVIQFDPTQFTKREVPGLPERKAGDRSVFVAASALTPKVGMTFTMLGVKWQVVSLLAEQDAWALQARRA